jgi:hypothetical protein
LTANIPGENRKAKPAICWTGGLVFAEGDLVAAELAYFACLTKIKDFCKMQNIKF